MKRLKILRRWFGRKFGYARLICLALLIGIAALRIADFAPIEELRVRTFDSFQRIDPRVKTARPVVIVDIDEKSLASKLGQWPWPRTRMADLVANLTRPGSIPMSRPTHFAISTRKPGPNCMRCRATIRFSPMRCGTRAWCLLNPDFARSSGTSTRHCRRRV